MYPALLKVTDPCQSLPSLPIFSFNARIKGNRFRLQNKQPSLPLNHICNLVSSIFLSINLLPNLPFCSPGPGVKVFHSFRQILSLPSRLSLYPLFPNPSMDPATRLQTGGLLLWQLVRSSYLPHSARFPCTLAPRPSPLLFLPGKQQAQVEKNQVCLF